jgi:hypothetical protein
MPRRDQAATICSSNCTSVHTWQIVRNLYIINKPSAYYGRCEDDFTTRKNVGAKYNPSSKNA